MTDTDLLILGGGCSGLSLGLRLAENARPSRTVILESRTAYDNDRTWCFWRQRSHRFEHLVSEQWSKMAVTSAARSIAFDCAATPYQMIPAGRFYAAAQQAVAQSGHVSLSTGVTVLHPPIFTGGRWNVSTSAGTITARRIVDTRPPSASLAADPLLWQSFYGQEIACERPSFDPTTVGLMHFARSLNGNIMFHYVLPSSPTCALVETTVFGPHRLGAPDLGVAQADAVARLCGGAPVSILREEVGVLPMGMSAPLAAQEHGYVRVGLMSGAARPSTGYAFQRIQRWADACAADIGAGREARRHQPDPILQRMMDRLFLRVLRGHPERGPELFVRMFGDAGADRVIRFLSDQGTLADCVTIGLHLPLRLFLGELARSLVQEPTARPPRAAIAAWPDAA